MNWKTKSRMKGIKNFSRLLKNKNVKNLKMIYYLKISRKKKQLIKKKVKNLKKIPSLNLRKNNLVLSLFRVMKKGILDIPNMNLWIF